MCHKQLSAAHADLSSAFIDAIFSHGQKNHRDITVDQLHQTASLKLPSHPLRQNKP